MTNREELTEVVRLAYAAADEVQQRLVLARAKSPNKRGRNEIENLMAERQAAHDVCAAAEAAACVFGDKNPDETREECTVRETADRAIADAIVARKAAEPVPAKLDTP